MSRLSWLLAFCAILLLSAGVAAARAEGEPLERCARCAVEDGYYLTAAPPDWDGVSPLPLVVYFHAWGRGPQDVIRAKGLIGPLHARGALVVAPFAEIGFWRQLGDGRAERGRDEAAYVRRILADVKRRWPIDESRMLASGFSRGASLVWNLACYESDLFTAYAPFAGGFWNSTPADCPGGPAALRHIHGTKDGIVAYDRVGLYNSMPIVDGLALFRRVNGAGEASAKRRIGGLSCEAWDGAKPLEVCLYQGGHGFPPAWAAQSFDWMLERASPG